MSSTSDGQKDQSIIEVEVSGLELNLDEESTPADGQAE
jgi:hypothetical protein